MSIETRLKDLRLEKNITQKELAEKLNINRVQYNQYENNYCNIPIKNLILISSFYNVSIDYILGFTNEANYKNTFKVDKIEAGKRLKEFRKENKLTQVKLASLLNTTFSTIAFYEKGRNLIATPFLYEICKKYNISADYLLGKTKEPKYLNLYKR